MQRSEVQALLREGIAAAKAGQKKTDPTEARQKRIYRIDTDRIKHREHARDLLTQVVELDETNVIAWLWLSTVMDDLAEKRLCLENVLVLDPDNKPAQSGLAQLARQAAAAPAKPELDPSPVAEAGLADHTVQTSNNETPCLFCQQPISIMDTTCGHCQLPLVVECPNCKTTTDIEHLHCSNCSWSIGDYRERPTYFAGLARAYQADENHRRALETWQFVEILDPDYPDLYVHMGRAQAALGYSQKAIDNLKRLLQEGPTNLAVYLALGNIYQETRRWRSAEATYREALQMFPTTAQAHFALGWLLMEIQRPQDALPYIRKATQLDPQHGMAWYRLAQLYEMSRQRGAATQAYKKAAALLSEESLAAQKSHERLGMLEPYLPKRLATGWMELTRQSLGPILICVLAALLDAGLRPWWISWIGWGALLLSIVGAFLWISGTTLPQNPVIKILVGEQGLASSELQVGVAFFGGMCWLLAMLIILLPIGQSIPEIPL
ncbi:MAG TPA: tetratricopeptide repeat protein [Anaerolineae bacterium]|jgi:tetratricopeptide (TPR) repeat protein